ncbi:MAG: Swt1 family HEPN domain-containing protein [Anaerosomatales bacterium]|nr:Swt1 family HEPN domain-containing protein [Anaerosomatales bacterium]
MALSNRDRVGKGLELLAQGLRPFVLREMSAHLGADWYDSLDLAAKAGSAEAELRDAYVLLKIMWDRWNDVFTNTLGRTERTYVSELRDIRNSWAHNEPFSTEDAYRALDTAERLLAAISAPEQTELDRMKQELLRIRYEEQARREKQKAVQTAIDGMPAAGLTPWREVVKPHHDVATGQYQTAEFAADLSQVHRGEGSDEYRDPVEFFRRTYLTEGLKSLLTRAAERLSGAGGDPVIELQTNFGGGKTHSLLALYHLFSDTPVEKLLGAHELLAAAGLERPEGVRRAVIVGTAISPGQPDTKPDGTVVRTLWGEIAWQLGGPEGYAMVAQADATATSPGAALNDLLKRYAPCMILIDEWVAYARQLYGNPGLPAGTFDTHFTFAQALTEAVKATPGALMVVSIPASDSVREVDGSSVSAAEVGGVGGIEALKRLKNVVGRLQSPWRPATAEESFEIVRRRLFEDMTDPEAFKRRDAVIGAFADLYAGQKDEFPTECREGEYRRRMEMAYPIHPELFERLYSDWSSLERFQRTRGVLRLMAAVVHALWVGEDRSLLIMPGTVPIHEETVLTELTRYLEDNWKPVIERDVDGPNSLPVKLDRENPALGRYSACRRVARTLYLGSAPTVGTKHPGLEDKRVKLGCVQPGESPAVFGDALRRLADAATHLATDGSRYFFTVKPTLNRLARDRADACKPADVEAEIISALRKAFAHRGEFAAVHVAPDSTGDVADDPDVRLVVLGPQHAHASRVDTSDAITRAREILETRGPSPRRFRNTLVFAAADRALVEQLEQTTRLYLAWSSIERDAETLNLGSADMAQVRKAFDRQAEALRHQIADTWQYAIWPYQDAPDHALQWNAAKVSGDGPLSERVFTRLAKDESIVTHMAGTVLRLWLDRIPLWKGDAIKIQELRDLFAQYTYLPRLRDQNVLLEAVQDGVASLNWQSETFGYAEALDEVSGEYRGVKAGEVTSIHISGYVVKPEVVARSSRGIEVPLPGAAQGPTEPGLWDSSSATGAEPVTAPETPASGASRGPRRFHGTVKIDPLAPGGDASKIAEAVLKHLAALPGATVNVELDIEAEIPGGAPDHVVRTVSENASVLKFDEFGFEE